MRIKLLHLALGVFITLTFSSIASAYSVHGALGTVVTTQTSFYVTFDNSYEGKCGSARFYLSGADWNDVMLLSKAVQSGRVVYFDYECRGQKNWITHFRWKDEATGRS